MFGINKWVIGLVAGLVLLGAFTTTVVLYGNGQYEAGAAGEQAKWAAKYDAALERIRIAEALATAEREARAAAVAERDTARNQTLHRVTQEITNAPDFETAFAAYVSFRDGLRHANAERHAQSRADYLSSLSSDPGARPVGLGPGPVGPFAEADFGLYPGA